MTENLSKKEQIEVLEKDLLKAYNCLFGCMNFEQLKSFKNYFNLYKQILEKELKFGYDFSGKMLLTYHLERHYNVFSSWKTEAIEDFDLRRECSKSFFEYKRVFKMLTLLQCSKPAKKSKFVIDFMTFQNELLLV
jgi:hypothetical protein